MQNQASGHSFVALSRNFWLGLPSQIVENNLIINKGELKYFAVKCIPGHENRKSSMMSPSLQPVAHLPSGSGRSNYSQTIFLKLKAWHIRCTIYIREIYQVYIWHDIPRGAAELRIPERSHLLLLCLYLL